MTKLIWILGFIFIGGIALTIGMKTSPEGRSPSFRSYEIQVAENKPGITQEQKNRKNLASAMNEEINRAFSQTTS
jgi:hypothetical protein